MKCNNSEKENLQNGDQKPSIISVLNQGKQSVPLGDQSKAVFRQHLMAFLMNLGMLSGGISLALPSVTLNQLTNPTADVYLNKSQESWFASCSSLTCPVGAMMSAFMTDRYGRKRTLIVSNILGIVGWALMAFPLKGGSVDLVILQLMASRLISGVVKGMGGSAAPVYAAEISLPKIRARLIMVVSMAIAGGVLSIYLLGYFIRDDWKMLGMILLGYQTICFILVIPVKESPIWFISKGRLEESKDSLSYFRGLEPGETHEEVEAEFVLMSEKVQLKSDERKLSFLRALSSPGVYKPFVLVFVLLMLQQFAGTFVVIVYAVQILTKSGIHIDPYLCALYIGIARFFMASFVMTWQLETWTRRQVGICSALCMAVCIFLLAGSNWFTWLQIPYLPAVVMVAYVVSCAGLWAMPFVIASEIFPQNFRGACCGIADSFLYFVSFIAIKLFPSMVDELGSGSVFAFCGTIALLTALFMFLCIPETKGKTLLEIEEYFRSKKRNVSEHPRDDRELIRLCNIEKLENK